MALVKGINSYGTVEEAEIYFADRLDASVFNAASEPRKAQALITGTMLLDSLDYTGAAVDADQDLAFPRSGYYFDPRVGTSVSMDPVPARMPKALFELALHLLSNEGLLDDTGRVDSLSMGGSLSIDGIRPASKIPGLVRRIIRPLLLNGGSTSWWRAN